MDGEKRLGGLDWFRPVAALLVVAIHTSPLASFHDTADFILTRVIARVAVPFFLMVTGYFLLPPYLFGHSRDFRPALRFFRKTLLLYALAALLYLPVNCYAGHFAGAGPYDVLRMLLFDGTMYHLWYLPASALGALLVLLPGRALPFGALTAVSLVLYALGLLGDSYYGLAAMSPVLRAVYDGLFHVFTYTRNGIFYVPVFLVMGAWLGKSGARPKGGKNLAGLLLSGGLMIGEGLLLHRLGWQRHDSMYLALLPCVFFLFRALLSLNWRGVKPLRRIATVIYLLHPLCLLLVRGAAKALRLEAVFVDNSLACYGAVCALSCAAAAGAEWLLSRLPKPRGGAGSGRMERERAWIELDRDSLRRNVQALGGLLPPGCELMPAVKANAYGHGAVPLCRELNAMGVRAFCVATVSEGVQLRRGGVGGEILVLGYTPPSQASLLRRYRLTQTVVDLPYARALNERGKRVKVHIKLDTGMHRLGERSQRLDAVCEIFRCENLSVTGTFTHLCAAGDPSPRAREYTGGQIAAFYDAVARLRRLGYACGKVHLLSSAGLMQAPECAGDYARVGIALYGVMSSRAELARCPVKLEPVLSLKARVALVRALYAGECAGYGMRYTAAQDEKLAVLAIGYADGVPRALSCGKGRVLLHGRFAPIVGWICMDQMLVNVTEIPQVKPGDAAVLIGRSGGREITACDWAQQAGTIANEALSRLGPRLRRVLTPPALPAPGAGRQRRPRQNKPGFQQKNRGIGQKSH